MSDINTKPDRGTPELHERMVCEMIDTGETRNQVIVRSEWPIDFYHFRRWISDRQFDAAREYYRLWYYGSEKSDYVSPNLMPLPRGRRMEDEARFILEEKYNEATRAIKCNRRKALLFCVICYGEWALKLNMDIGKNNRMTMLKDGLDELADHFRIPL